MARRRLGRGLDGLLPAAPPPSERSSKNNAAIEDLQPGRMQPRARMDAEALAELAASIREHGVLEPILVRNHSGGGFEIIAGERRWRAAQQAGLKEVPIFVHDLGDEAAFEAALVENLQREDLNPIDQARSLSRLAQEFGLTHQQVADAVGRSRSAVSNLLRLLDLNDGVKDMLADGRLDMGHARALLPLDLARQIKIATRAAEGGWSVRQVEKAVRQRLDAESRKPRPAPDSQTRWLQEQLVRELAGRVMLKSRADGSYKLDIGFSELGELQQALEQVQGLIGKLRETAGPRLRDAARK